MTLFRLISLIQGLEQEEFQDMHGFLAYRHHEGRITCKLLHLLREKNGPTTKPEICRRLEITDGSFRTSKSELLKLIIEWRSINSHSWNSPSLRKLIGAHTLLEWGECQQADQLATQVQHEAQQRCHFAVARLALELRSALVQRIYPDDTAKQLQLLVREMEDVNKEAELLKKSTDLYVQVATLAEKNMLLRDAQQAKHFAELRKHSRTLMQQQATPPFNIRAYQLQTNAIMAQLQGDTDACFAHLHQLWQLMNTPPMPIPLGDHRFYQFFLSFIETAICSGNQHQAQEANVLYRKAIALHYGNDPRLSSLSDLFNILIQLQNPNCTFLQLVELRKMIAQIRSADSDPKSGLNILQWELYISASILPLLISTCFKHSLYKECTVLLGIVKQMNAKHSGAATELQTIAPLIGLVVQYEQLQADHQDHTSDRTFEAESNYCYHYFRKKQEHYPIEWQLSRLFNGLSSGKKCRVKLFDETHSAINANGHAAPYRNAFMQLFDFNGWMLGQA